MTILVGSHLSFNAVRNKLTPRLGLMLPALDDELDYGLGIEIPSCKGMFRKLRFAPADANPRIIRHLGGSEPYQDYDTHHLPLDFKIVGWLAPLSKRRMACCEHLHHRTDLLYGTDP